MLELKNKNLTTPSSRRQKAARLMMDVRCIMSLKHPAEDISNRSPVWVAMTDFFLDSELTEGRISYIARICAESPYSIRELEKIIFKEVWPAFLPNLLSMAGEWCGWSEGFIQKRVIECYRPRLYISWRINPLKWFFCKDWRKVEKIIIKIRSQAS